MINLHWAEMSPKERARIISHLSDLLRQNSKHIAETMAKEIGKPITAGHHEVEISNKRIADFCSYVPNGLEDEIIFDSRGEKNVVRYEPAGAVAVISPWNAPVFVSLAGIIPPLLCGNTVIWKPSEHATKTGRVLTSTIKKLEEFGLPKNVFRVRYGDRTVGRNLVASDVATVSLTGSVRAGQEVMRVSADKLHRLVLELGGKDPAIVLDDADIAQAARQIVKSATMYSGQVCFGVERVYCHTKIYEKFVNACVEEIKKIKVGDPLDESVTMGPMSVKFQYEKVLSHIQDARSKGAKILTGCEAMDLPGYFIGPGVLINVNHSMKIMREETFGPVVPVMKFSSVNQAVKLANDTIYGLTASIWTKNIKKGERLASRIQAGTVEINRHGMSKAGLPWGGYKMSGIGRIYSMEGIRSAFTNIKHVWTVKKF